MNDISLLILAAGLGSRYGSLKQMDQFGPSGESIIDYSVYDAMRAGFTKVVFVIRSSMEQQFKEAFLKRFPSDIEVKYVFQELDHLPAGHTVSPEREKPWGTGHAVWTAADQIDEPFAVINADDFYGRESLQRMAEFLKNPPENSHCLLGYKLENTLSDYGYVSRGICAVQGDSLQSITERTHIERRDDGQIIFRSDKGEEVPLSGKETASMNLMGFTPDVFSVFERCFVDFLKENSQHPKQEFYLPSVVNEIINSKIAEVKVVPTPDSWFGVTYPDDKQVARQTLQNLVAEGVYPPNLWAK
ncbi:nucleotidyltransferase family protein [Tunicatimonas pelagia]|uniref:nucleotidyltransferase family protein n=1 Tax=Tunicatimonas pelagia TaxID=931531 RepID=UPI00266592E1|nr:sugar phosphate nucleotidyltransferase [Tunicatimonas pelagia]WKN42792.1 sugar phosphate nucleotidyltransferase [Tunicatimonas pelagia]